MWLITKVNIENKSQIDLRFKLIQLFTVLMNKSLKLIHELYKPVSSFMEESSVSNCLPVRINPCCMTIYLSQEINYIPCSMGPHCPHGAARFKFVPLTDNIICFYKLVINGKLLKSRKYDYLTARNIWPYFAVYYNFAKWRIHQLGQVKRSWWFH